MPPSAARQFLSPRNQTDQFPAPKQKTNNSQPNHDHENVLSHSLVVSVRVFPRAQAHVAATTAASIGRRRHSLSRSPPRLSHRTLRRSKRRFTHARTARRLSRRGKDAREFSSRFG